MKDEEVAKLVVSGNKIIKSHTLCGLNVKATETKSGIDVDIVLEEGIIIEKPVQFCFGVLHTKLIQEINLNLIMRPRSKMSVVGHCVFMGDTEITHIMNGKIRIEEGADFEYYEKHIHDEAGKMKVIPKAEVHVEKNARYKTEFELLKGKVGEMDIHYSGIAEDNASIEMEARVNAYGKDKVKINETADLRGAHSKAVLKSRVACRNTASAVVHNTIEASGDSAKGHVDCTEILQDEGTVQAFPNVKVIHPKAHVTHEAKLGGVDNKELETLMARGLSEEQAEEYMR
jgi:hypothetical protein